MIKTFVATALTLLTFGLAHNVALAQPTGSQTTTNCPVEGVATEAASTFGLPGIAALATGALLGTGIGLGWTEVGYFAFSEIAQVQAWLGPIIGAGAGALLGNLVYMASTWTPEQPQGPLLQVGTTGPRVASLVDRLIAKGYYKGPTTDTYSPEVAAAVRRFQQDNNLCVDGIAGPQTLIFLDTP